ncbi:unnamed protein product, partial [Phaeothamnion confervicola]
LALAVGVAARAAFKKPRISYHAVLMLIGLIVGLALRAALSDGGDSGLGAWGTSLLTWVDVSPLVAALLFLPLLVVDAALGVDVHVFRRELGRV